MYELRQPINLAGFLLFLSLIIWAPAALCKPVIFNYSCIAGKDDAVNLQGHELDETASVVCSINAGPEVPLKIINRGNNVLHVLMPSIQGLYGVTVRKGLERSNTVYPNRADPMQIDTSEVAPNGVFRIFGRNLCAPNCTPEITLTQGRINFKATVCGEMTFSELKVRVPAEIPAGRYSVFVSNGLAHGSSARCANPLSLEVLKVGKDHFELGVPWSSNLKFASNIYNVKTDNRLSIHAVGDGVTNDQPAIQAAVVIAKQAGGGVVFLPAGSYAMANPTGVQIDFANNVVVQGDGQGATKILYGFGKPSKDFVFAQFYNVSKCGFYNLSIKNLNENSVWLNTKSITNEGSPIDKVFLSKTSIDLGNGFRIDLKGNRIAIKNCVFKSIYTTLFLGTSTNSQIESNEITQKLGVHLDMTQTSNCVVASNKFVLDANDGEIVPGNVRHGIAISFAKNLVVTKNIFSTTNGVPVYNNDGEAILSEGGGGVRIGEETGDIIHANNSGAVMSKTVSFIDGTVMAIINGRGSGQWRHIASRQGNVVHVNQPWSVTPDRSSKYAIFCWSSCNTLISNNTFNSWLRGVWIYQASTTGMQVTNNKFNEMDGIFFEPCQNLSRNNGQFNPIWNTTVDHNVLQSQRVSAAVPKPKATATYINFTADLQQTSNLLGTMALNCQIFSNTIFGTGAEFFESEPAFAEGYCSYLRVESPKFDVTKIPALLGFIFQRNKSIGCGKQSYLINGGDFQTSILDFTESGSPCVYTDTSACWNTPGNNTAIGTVVKQQSKDRPTRTHH